MNKRRGKNKYRNECGEEAKVMKGLKREKDAFTGMDMSDE